MTGRKKKVAQKRKTEKAKAKKVQRRAHRKTKPEKAPKRAPKKKAPPALKKLMINGEHLPLYSEALRTVTVDTWCRCCDTRVLKGTTAYFRRGETYCGMHHKDHHVPKDMRFYAANWRCRCDTCKVLIDVGQPLFWRSRTVCLTCAEGKEVLQGPPPEEAARRAAVQRKLTSMLTMMERQMSRVVDDDVEYYPSGMDNYGSY